MMSFLQSHEWQEVQERMDRPARWISGVLVIRHDLPFGLHYLYVPRPGTLAAEFFREAVAFGQESRAVFLKIDPSEELEMRSLKLEIKPSDSLQPHETVLIDCRKPDTEILAAMHPKTRYNMRLAERHGVLVEKVLHKDIPKIFPKFFELLVDTATRGRFSIHPPAHYRILLDVRSSVFANELWMATFAGAPLAFAIINCYQLSRTVTYLHGASSRLRPEVMAPYLLHGEIIRYVRSRALQFYDVGGVDERRWPGLTRFKKGFGGRLIEFPPSSDVVVRPRLYAAYRWQQRLRHGF